MIVWRTDRAALGGGGKAFAPTSGISIRFIQPGHMVYAPQEI